MAGKDLQFVANQDRVGKAKSLNALGNLLYLRARVTPRVFCVGAQRGEVDHFDRKGAVPNRFVHDLF
jgi:hypothetical protein